MRTKFVAALAAGLLAVPMAASAAIVTQLIHFDDATNGWKWYSDKDLNFLFSPTNFNSSVQCAASTNGNNGNCVLEGQQTELPLMTRPTTGPQSQGSASPQDPPQFSGMEKFTLDSFYFLLTGNGTAAENAITVQGGTGTAAGQNVVNTFTFALGGLYDNLLPTAPEVTFEAGGDAGALVKLTGYVANFGGLFKDVTWIQFSSADSAQVRLDCVVATFDGKTTEPLKPGTLCGIGNGGGGGQNEIPEPGSLALAGLALLGAYAMRRRKL